MDYNISIAAGASILFVWNAASNFTPILGAFLSDSYLGRFRVISLGTITSLFGVILLWLTTIIPGAKPPSCIYGSSSCMSPTPSQLALLFSAFALMSIGAGGVRPCSLAFGADQLDKKDNPNNERLLQSFFNWYYASVGISIMISITVIVYIQDTKGWRVGFGIPVVLMILSTIFFLLGSRLYVKTKANKSLFTGFAQVIVVSVKNRRLAFPPKNVDGWYHHQKGSKIVSPTDKIRYLNKACIIRNPGQDLNPDGSAAKPWNLCTVEQVEDFKSLIRVLPIWSTGIMAAVTISQHSFQVLQANTMDRHIGSKFQIPPGSFGVFGILTLTLWVAIYDRLLVPILAKITGRPRGLSLKQRMGIGLLISCTGTAVAAVVERARRRTAIEEGFANNPRAVVDMSAMWLIPQHSLVGLAEAFSAIGQLEFFYAEFPKSMSSIGVALVSLGMGFGNLMGTVIVGLVEESTKSSDKESWVSSNLNKGHFDYYYWLLTVLSALNLIYFLVCSWAYGPCKEDQARVSDVVEETKVEETIVEDKSRTMELSMLL
eukprot:TRINITY_DN25711_c0_g1_i1.p1 TRINITY_DN25711_c0_g1~~TRINITY_DN25711_c0_g1_i1.p1  ORF type:complete len:614 (+),score=84.81 TRINITY_DN25711_c0_g1_i1:213-1844(+)